VLLVVLGLTHVTIAAVTIFLHRHQAHRALELHPVVSHFFRFWLWMTTGMVTAEWVAIHRKHHAKCETADDPHSPKIKGIDTVVWRGAELYRDEAANAETIANYRQGTPDDWLERRLYSRFVYLGISLMLLIDIALFGVLGLTVWAVQMIWIPFFAAGVINGLGHWWGYRNFESRDMSTNISPLGLLIGGEELHNNHHAYPASARLSSKWWEFDIGWLYIRLLELVGLARVKKVAPQTFFQPGKRTVDLETVRAVVRNRLGVMAVYARDVLLPVFREELASADQSCKRMFRQARRLVVREPALMDDSSRSRLADLLKSHERLATVYQYRERLQAIWNRQATSHDHLVKALQEWCVQAEASGIKALQEFAQRLRGYTLQPVG
jgi:stearoyl-CoA desaturase (delta-9 desaturase)